MAIRNAWAVSCCIVALLSGEAKGQTAPDPNAPGMLEKAAV